MARSHPPTLLKLAERTLRDECALPRPARLLVAVSGGGDSQALLHVLAKLAPRLGIELFRARRRSRPWPEARAELGLAASWRDAAASRCRRRRFALQPEAT